ncbi:putative lipoprotein [Hyphomonas polymorpha PS728]|uniref:Putative lipoprotein n=1 Tax=Hyphomonas polymorpha PS728 TaxID=1280954 RepID=A0A062VE28_9PROT|nr:MULTISPECIES: hypothetical protein [Hyphomonas]AXE65744.1 hypothetical protein BBF93_17025 [Hyphomonas sp. CACIAM 19H1]KCZ98592.1 putative lipoprotein [Hyphomonas polymorpha PS728]
MKYLLTGVIAITLLTACGQKDKPSGEAALAAVEFDVSKLSDISLRKGDAATASQALAAFSLAESGSGILSFDSRDINGDKAVFTNVILSIPRDTGPSEPLYTEEEIAELFSYMDYDGDGIADDGSEMTLEEYSASMNATEPAGPPPVVKAAKLEFDGLGMINGAANFSLMRLSDISVTPVEGSEDQSRGTVGTIELINPSPETAAWVASLFGQGEPADLPEGAALSFDRWAIKDVDLDIVDASGSGGFELASFYIDGLKEEKAGKLGLSKLNFQFSEETSGDVNITLDGFGLAGLDYGLIAAAANSSADPTAMTEAMQADPGNPGFDAALMKGLKADVIGASIDMASFNSYVGRDGQGRATKITTDPFTLTVAARDNPDGEQFAGALATLGYETLTLSAAGEQLYDPDADVVTLPKGKNYWQLNDGFKLDVSAKYEGSKAIAAASSAAQLEANPDAMMEAMMSKLAFHQFEVSFADNGFFNRALNAYAAQSGEDPANLRAQISGVMAMAPMMAGSTGIDVAVVTELATAISSFVQDPKTLTISMTPQTPVTAQTFVDAASNPSDPAKKLDKTKLGFSAGNK